VADVSLITTLKICNLLIFNGQIFSCIKVQGARLGFKVQRSRFEVDIWMPDTGVLDAGFLHVKRSDLGRRVEIIQKAGRIRPFYLKLKTRNYFVIYPNSPSASSAGPAEKNRKLGLRPVDVAGANEMTHKFSTSKGLFFTRIGPMNRPDSS
jgi:hypothetical protein